LLAAGRKKIPTQTPVTNARFKDEDWFIKEMPHDIAKL